MALFRRGPDKDHETLVAEFAQQAFTALGLPAQIVQGTGPGDIDIMVGASAYPLHNLILKTQGMTGKALQRDVSTHVGSLVRAERARVLAGHVDEHRQRLEIIAEGAGVVMVVGP